MDNPYEKPKESNMNNDKILAYFESIIHMADGHPSNEWHEGVAHAFSIFFPMLKASRSIEKYWDISNIEKVVPKIENPSLGIRNDSCAANSIIEMINSINKIESTISELTKIKKV